MTIEYGSVPKSSAHKWLLISLAAANMLALCIPLAALSQTHDLALMRVAMADLVSREWWWFAAMIGMDLLAVLQLRRF